MHIWNSFINFDFSCLASLQYYSTQKKCLINYKLDCSRLYDFPTAKNAAKSLFVETVAAST